MFALSPKTSFRAPVAARPARSGRVVARADNNIKKVKETIQENISQSTAEETKPMKEDITDVVHPATPDDMVSATLRPRVEQLRNEQLSKGTRDFTRARFHAASADCARPCPFMTRTSIDRLSRSPYGAHACFHSRLIVLCDIIIMCTGSRAHGLRRRAATSPACFEPLAVLSAVPGLLRLSLASRDVTDPYSLPMPAMILILLYCRRRFVARPV
jgi:hypothetical protein